MLVLDMIWTKTSHVKSGAASSTRLSQLSEWNCSIESLKHEGTPSNSTSVGCRMRQKNLHNELRGHNQSVYATGLDGYV